MIKSMIPALALLLVACSDSESDAERGSGGAAGSGGSSAGGQMSGGAAGSSASANGGTTPTGGNAGAGGSGTGGSGTGGSATGGGSGAGGGSGTGGGDAGTGGSAGGGPDCDCMRGAYIPVCGVDGMEHDATCGIECVSVGIACLGPCPCDTGTGCDIGCTKSGGSTLCQGDQVEWLCQGTYQHQLLQDAGCQDLPTGAIRYCCPSSFLSACE